MRILRCFGVLAAVSVVSLGLGGVDAGPAATVGAEAGVLDDADSVYSVYAGYAIVRVSPRDASDRLSLAQLPLDLVSEAESLGGVGDYLADPATLDLLRHLGIPFETIEADVQALVDAERVRLDARVRYDAAGGGGANEARFGGDPDAFFREYRDIEELMALWDGFVGTHPALISREVVGQSVEGRDIVGYTISGSAGGEPLSKPTLVFNGTIHAREWISPMTVSYIGRGLVEGYGIDDRITRLLDANTFRIIPVLNPDGYVYSWESERLWRKNRRQNSPSRYGVDLNRNFATGWGGGGSSGNSGSNTYRGPSPFSEPESRALRDYLLATPNRVFHIDFHSYSQLVLWPWGHRFEEAPDVDALTGLGTQYAETIRSTTGANYTPQQATELYQASGITTDWAYDEAGVLGFTIELRPRASNFAPPPETILPCARENYAAVLTLTEAMESGLGEGAGSLPFRTQAGEVATPIYLDLYSARGGSLDEATLTLRSRVEGAGSFSESVMSRAYGLWTGTLATALCGETIEYGVVAEWDDGETAEWPAGGDASLNTVVATDVRAVFVDDMETDRGWIGGLPSDTAETGMWERADPEATFAGATNVQPGDDRSLEGTVCWITDNRIGPYAYSYDLNNGFTTLISPASDLSTTWGEREISFWLWYSTSEDPLDIDISGDDGQTWRPLDRVETSTDGWELHAYAVPSDIERSPAVRVRFVARDEGLVNSNVEAGVDDFQIVAMGCGGNPADLAPPFGVLDIADIGAFVSAFTAQGAIADLTGDGLIDLSDIADFVTYFTADP